MRVAVRDGLDPAAARDGQRNAKTVGQLCDEHLKACGPRLKPSTYIMERSRIENHVRPLLGSKPVASLKSSDLEQFLADVASGKSAQKGKSGKTPRGGKARGGKAAAARTVEMLCAIFEAAVRDGLIPSNPASKVRKPKRNPIKPPFSFSAVTKLGVAMRELEREGEALNGLRTIRFLLLSGFRRMEALTLQWGMVDAAAHCARLVDTKTGPQTRPLGQSALDHLAAFCPKGAKPKDFVFPGAGEAGHYIGAPKAWARIFTRAKIEGVSLHGLRHWFASAGAEMNFSELVIAGIIGHKVRSVTGRYATTPDSALVAAADAIATKLAAALDGSVAPKA
jgi:integrase